MEEVKENILIREPLSLRWLALGALSCALAALALLAAGERLPASLPRSAPPTSFIGDNAHRHLVNLTSIGPRVAGSYENEVLAVGALVVALREIAAGASAHHILEIDVHTASGAFPLAFLDGMNNVYRDVQSVVARLSARGGRPPPAARRTALLINCHFDTVPDSPGASDDGAGCAVGLETLRALAAHPAPHAHDVLLLLNGAEENIMQASHAFITTHKWAPSVRAFINVEACGAGGREVLFQAGPHDPWIMEVYAASVPHPFTSSLAQEIFESGIIPADTDFRVFRDFGNLSGVDLAWSANGYVYHTRLDTAERAPPSALQRTGDNVLALAKGLLQSGRLSRKVERTAGQPVFFDVLGVGVVLLRSHAAVAVAALAVAAAGVRIQLHARLAREKLYMKRSEWWRLVLTTLIRGVGGALCGLGWAAAAGAGVHAGAALAFYSQPWLLAPLYAVPAVAVSWLATLRLTKNVGPTLRGWPRARLAGDALCLFWAALLLLCTIKALRSGFIPALWTIGLSSAGIVAHSLGARGGAALACGAAGAALPALQTGYVALDALAMLVPIMGRSGPVPHDVSINILAHVLGARGGAALACGAAGAALPALQTGYVALDALAMLVPIMGRSGPVPHDVSINILAHVLGARGGAALACGAAGAALPALQTGYVALDALAMLVPIMGRSGPVPHDVSINILAHVLGARGGAALACGAAGAALPALQTGYVALDALAMLVPIMGRSGPVPHDVSINILAHVLGARGGAALACGAAGAALPALQTGYVALDALAMLVPIMGRSGPVPHDVSINILAHVLGARGGAALACGAAGAALPALQTGYVALDALAMLVPIMGRSGPVPHDVSINILAHVLGARGGAALACGAAGAALPALQTGYVALDALAMLVPIMGRSGPVPHDVSINILAHVLGARGGAALACGAAGAALPALQTGYVALDALAMLVPIMGRSGPVPHDVSINILAHVLGARGGAALACGAAGAALPALQTGYVALDALAMLVPIMGRSGPVPHDVSINILAHVLGARGGAALACGAAGAALPALQTGYVALDALAMLVPIMGRSGPVPHDVSINILAHVLGARGGAALACGAAGAALPALQTGYVALDALAMLVPIMGRSGPVPHDVSINILAHVLGARGGAALACGAAGAALPALQTGYVALDALAMLVPIMGRSGPVPHDVSINILAHVLGARGGAALACGAAGAALPALQTGYVALDALAMLVPIMGRSGPVPHDVSINILAHVLGARGGAALACGAAGAALPALQTGYVALDALAMLVPIMGRSGPVPHDVSINILAHVLGARGGAALACGAAGAALPALQTGYVALDALAMLVPIMGRSGPVPHDVSINILAHVLGARGGAALACGAAGAALPALQTGYVALDALAMLVPIMGRSGPVPHDVSINILAHVLGARGGAALACGAAGAALPALQTGYVALDALAMLVPIMGRSGPVPHDVSINILAHVLGARGGAALACGAAGAALPALQTGYVALDALAMLVPIMGRSGPVPHDVSINILAHVLGARGGAALACGAAGAALPALQTGYVALDALAMLVPIMGRSGPVPHDVSINILAHVLGARGGAALACGAAGAALPALQTGYVALDALAMLVPIMGRSGPVPHDVSINILAHVLGARGGAALACGAAGAALPALQTGYVALDALAMLVPIMGRSGPVPHDVSINILAHVLGARGGAALACGAAGAALPALQTGYVALDALAMLVPIMGRSGPVPHDVSINILAHVLGARGGAALACGAAGAALPALQTGYVALDALAMLVPIMGRSGPVPHDVSINILAHVLGARGGAALACGAAGAALPALQTGYVALDALAMLVPIMGRSGPVPHDIVMGVVSASLALATACWLLPLAAVARKPYRLVFALLALQAVTTIAVLFTPLGNPYSATRPQRLMVFHTRRTDHTTGKQENIFWMPDLDSNSPHSLDPYVPAFRSAVPTSAPECARWVYCGAPYYLPARGFIPRGHAARAPTPPLTVLAADLRLENTPPVLYMNLTGPTHVVVILSPVEGVRITHYTARGAGGGAPHTAAPWGARRTYFLALHDARSPAPWQLAFHLQLDAGATPPTEAWLDVSVAGHSQSGPHKEAPALKQLLAALPPHAAPAATGWGVDLHLYTV